MSPPIEVMKKIQEIIKCSIIMIPNKGLAIFRSEKYLIILIESEKKL